jgi:hypothetical protein
MRLFGNSVAAAVLAVLLGTTMMSTSLMATPRDGGARAERQRPSQEEMQKRRQDDQQRFGRMCDFLGLDESQQEQAKTLFEARREQMKTVREKVRSGELDREQARQVMQDGFKAHRTSFEALLSSDQLEKLAILEEQRKTRPGKKQGRPDGDTIRKLGLNDTQKDQLAEFRKQHHENLRGIRDRIKAEELEREQARELLKSEHDRFRHDLSGVLSAKQLEQLDSLKGRMVGKGKRGRGKAGPVGHLMRHIRGRLELNDSQLEQLRELAAPYRQQVKETLGQAREQELEREQVHLLIKPLADAFIGELAGILDEGQQAKLNEFLELRDERRRQRAAEEGDAGISESTAASTELTAGVELPKGFSLAQNSPNPFNPSTTISYSVPEGAGRLPVSLSIYDVRGRELVRLVDSFSGGGSYSVTWDGMDNNGHQIPSGVYIYRLRAGEYEQSRKMVMLK